jgi:hypothetical protein
MTVETCHRCRAVTDTDEDHRCPHGEYCQMLDGNTGDCRSYCHVCDDELRDAEVAALRENVAHFQTSTAKYMEEAMALRARVAELEAEAAAVAPWISPEAQHCMDAGKVHPLAPVLNAYVASVAEDARAAMLSPMRGAGLGFHSSRSQATRMLIMVMWDALQASRDELLKPRSPKALELAMEYGIAHAVCVMHTDSSPFFIEGFARRSRAIAALVAYDDWRPK